MAVSKNCHFYKEKDSYFTFFFALILEPGYIRHTKYTSVWTSPILSALWPHVGSGYYVRKYRSIIILLSL